MNWFLIALGAPFLWAIVNIADNYLVSKYSDKERERSSGGLVLFSSLIGLVIAILIFIFQRGLFDISNIDKFILFICGGLTIVWIVFYLYALEIEEVSSIVPWYLLVPVFGYFLGYIFLGENLSANQIIGSLIILLGSVVISFDFKTGKKRFKKKLAFYMVLSSIAIALSGFLFKFVTNEGSFWVSSFWEYLSLGLIGILIYIFSHKYRNEFKYMNSKGGKKILLLNTISEFISVGGNLLTSFAILLAPITLVYLVSSFQPAILIILTIIGTKFFPHIITEDLSKRTLIPKISAILIMILGSLFLFI